jgi:hypothetical protein
MISGRTRNRWPWLEAGAPTDGPWGMVGGIGELGMVGWTWGMVGDDKELRRKWMGLGPISALPGVAV